MAPQRDIRPFAVVSYTTLRSAESVQTQVDRQREEEEFYLP